MRPPGLPFAALLPALLGLAACERAPTPPTPPPAILALDVEDAGGPIFRTLRLRLDREAAVEVEYAAEGSPALRVTAPPAVEHSLFLPRLRSGSVYDYRVEAVAADGRRGEPRSGRFATAPLPPDLAGIRFAARGTPTTPLVALSIRTEGGFNGYAVTDAEGRVVWYLDAEGPYGIVRRANGDFAFLSDRGLFAVTPARRVVAQVPTDSMGRRFHHDVVVTPDHTLLAIATDTQTVRGRRITGEAVWEWSPETGELHKRWSAFDFLDPATDRGAFSEEGDWMHANSLWLGPRGNVLLSSNFLSQILSISPDYRALEWRLGGPNATITVPEEERFTGQHTAAEIEPGRILLFDNRREQGGYSRAVELELDGAEARRAWEWRPERVNFAFAVSSARRLPSGSTLVAFGMSPGLAGSTGPTEVYEVDREGTVLWHLEVSGITVLYRAEPLSDIAGEAPASGPAG